MKRKSPVRGVFTIVYASTEREAKCLKLLECAVSIQSKSHQICNVDEQKNGLKSLVEEL